MRELTKLTTQRLALRESPTRRALRICMAYSHIFLRANLADKPSRVWVCLCVCVFGTLSLTLAAPIAKDKNKTENPT